MASPVFMLAEQKNYHFTHFTRDFRRNSAAIWWEETRTTSHEKITYTHEILKFSC